MPVGFEALLPLMESDREGARAFLGGVHFLFNAAAAMPSATRSRLEALAETLGIDVPPVIGAWGSTETAPFSTVVHFSTPYADNLGVPMPGTTIRLIPADGKFELRVKGPNVTPGYWRAPEATRQAFDADGFFRIGDAGKLADPAHPEQGIRFDGRIAENFKLSSGTWVNAGALRLRLLDAVRPYASELVVVGQDRDELGVLIFADQRECGIHLGEDPARIAPEVVAEHPLVIATIRDRLARYNLGADGSSTRIARFLLLAEPPSSEHGELTDKGSINQRALVARRAADIGRLFERDGRQVGAHAPDSD